jgi:uroporphyrin-III C-methyltransferase
MSLWHDSAVRYPVVLAGSGPGDPDLITLKLRDRLSEADVILPDRLVNPLIYERLAKKDAEIIPVGKAGWQPDSMPQEVISALLVEHALKGKRVLRLKGGDVAIFSNVQSEIDAILNAGLQYEIIPGITAASGAAAYAGMPLTARGVSRGVRFLTLHDAPHAGPNWQALAENPEETLVFYMSTRNIATIFTELGKRIQKDRAVLIIENATMPAQRYLVGSLFNPEPILESGGPLKTPMLVIVGDVVHTFLRREQLAGIITEARYSGPFDEEEFL